MNKDFVTNDSGERKEFESGMRRDTDKGKPMYNLIWAPILKRWALLMSRGADKYGTNNWQRANSQEELARFKESAYRHFIDWLNEWNTEEDHAVGIMFNIMAVEYIKDKLSKDNYKKIFPSQLLEQVEQLESPATVKPYNPELIAFKRDSNGAYICYCNGCMRQRENIDA